MVDGRQQTPVNVMLRGECSLHSPPVAQMIIKNQKGLTGSIKSLQATRDGAFRRRCAMARQASFASRFTAPSAFAWLRQDESVFVWFDCRFMIGCCHEPGAFR